MVKVAITGHFDPNLGPSAAPLLLLLSESSLGPARRRSSTYSNVQISFDEYAEVQIE